MKDIVESRSLRGDVEAVVKNENHDTKLNRPVYKLSHHDTQQDYNFLYMYVATNRSTAVIVMIRLELLL